MTMMMSRPVALRSGLARAAPSLPVRIGAPTALRLPQRVQAAQNDSNVQASRRPHCSLSGYSARLNDLWTVRRIRVLIDVHQTLSKISFLLMNVKQCAGGRAFWCCRWHVCK